MKKVLLLINESHLDTNVTIPTDYSNIIDKIKVQGGGNCGNKLFVTAVFKYLFRSSVDLSLFSPEMTPEYINEMFDIVVYPTANIFGYHYTSGLLDYSRFFNRIKIPVYVIGAGLQIKSVNDLKNLKGGIARETSAFVESVYQTGGEIALRGEYTKEFLDSVVKNTAVVTGCPSIYQNGPDLSIDYKPVEFDHFRVAINGNSTTVNKTGLYKVLNDSVYIDQDEFAYLLFDKNLPNISTMKTFYKYSSPMLEAYINDRIMLFYDIPVWMNYIKNNIDFSIGTRIHGNICALLQGVPSYVISCDLRTREMAEFFGIPTSENFKCRGINDLYDLYCNLDYSNFNKTYKTRYKNFEAFMVNHGIVDSIIPDACWDEMISCKNWMQPQQLQDNRNRMLRIYRKTPSLIKCCFKGNGYSFFKEHKKQYKITYTNIEN